MQVYVGTYAKYANGSLFGKHLDPSDYEDKQGFLDACLELHKDESDPELMFQDHEGIPSGMISESSISEELWDFIDLVEHEQDVVQAYHENLDGTVAMHEILEACTGVHDSEADWAEDWLVDSGDLAQVPERLRYYFDFAAYARDCRLSGDVDFAHYNGQVYVFVGL
jgi:antirestriction protein